MAGMQLLTATPQVRAAVSEATMEKVPAYNRDHSDRSGAPRRRGRDRGAEPGGPADDGEPTRPARSPVSAGRRPPGPTKVASG
ncbi:hypothetical protein GCM10009605_33410 [Nocardiopsis composta]